MGLQRLEIGVKQMFRHIELDAGVVHDGGVCADGAAASVEIVIPPAHTRYDVGQNDSRDPLKEGALGIWASSEIRNWTTIRATTNSPVCLSSRQELFGDTSNLLWGVGHPLIMVGQRVFTPHFLPMPKCSARTPVGAAGRSKSFTRFEHPSPCPFTTGAMAGMISVAQCPK